MKDISRIILVGYMGSGKSTLGKKLALKLKIPFIDSDVFIERNEGKTISEIFQEKGEEGFRKLETEFIHSLSTTEKYVLSVGGGTPCFNQNMDFLNVLGVTVYINKSPEILAKRLVKGQEKRPLIAGKSEEELIEFIDQNLKTREKFYKKALVNLEFDYKDIESVLSFIQIQK